MDYREILLVDDGSPYMLTVAFILVSGGYEVLMAPDAETAAEELKNYHFGLVIFRCPWGEYGPLKLLQELRRPGSAIKVMVVGEKQGQPMAPEALEAAAEDYLLLPCRPLLLCQRVEACLGKEANRRPKPARGLVSREALARFVLFMGFQRPLRSLAADLLFLSTGAFGAMEESAAHRARLLAVQAARLLRPGRAWRRDAAQTLTDFLAVEVQPPTAQAGRKTSPLSVSAGLSEKPRETCSVNPLGA